MLVDQYRCVCGNVTLLTIKIFMIQFFIPFFPHFCSTCGNLCLFFAQNDRQVATIRPVLNFKVLLEQRGLGRPLHLLQIQKNSGINWGKKQYKLVLNFVTGFSLGKIKLKCQQYGALNREEKVEEGKTYNEKEMGTNVKVRLHFTGFLILIQTVDHNAIQLNFKPDLSMKTIMQQTEAKKNELYGFYCPVLNKFYYLENQQVYLELLRSLQGGPDQIQSSEPTHQNQNDTVQYYCKLVDQDIEDIFRHPLFAKPVEQMQLKEYDVFLSPCGFFFPTLLSLYSPPCLCPDKTILQFSDINSFFIILEEHGKKFTELRIDSQKLSLQRWGTTGRKIFRIGARNVFIVDRSSYIHRGLRKITSLNCKQQDPIIEGPMMMPSQKTQVPDFFPCINFVRQINGTCPTMKAKKNGLTILKINASRYSWSIALNKNVIPWALFL